MHGFSIVRGSVPLSPMLFEAQLQLGMCLPDLWQRTLAPCKSAVHFCHRFTVCILGMDYV